jgi:hypothetical protein
MGGFFSNLFGGNTEQKALQAAFAKIERILDDEQFQLEMIDPAMKAMIESQPSYDRDPNGSGPFGFSDSNPIPVNGPIGQLAYLSKLETAKGERILFHRIGAIDTIDVFEAVTFSGSEWFIFFIDLYHPRRSKLSPEGFRFMKGVGQFSGFHKFCRAFPYDFVEMKHTERESGLSLAYIPISKVGQHLQDRVFQRPLAHKAKLDLVNSRLTSTLSQ